MRRPSEDWLHSWLLNRRMLALMAAALLGHCVSIAQQNRPFNTIGSAVTGKTDTLMVAAEESEAVFEYMSEDEYAGLDGSVKAAEMVAKKQVNPSLPLDSVTIVSAFGSRWDPIDRGTKKMHNGVDLRADRSPVYAMLPGTVKVVGYQEGGGLFVRIGHYGFDCTYLHLSKVMVRKGETVKAGETVAVSGNTGKRTTGPHLHVSCRISDSQSPENGKYFDPLILFRLIDGT